MERTLTDASAKQEESAAIDDPHDRLEELIRYFLPLDDESTVIERARVALASQQNVEPIVAEHLKPIDPRMLGFQDRDRRLPLYGFAGMLLTVIEHPTAWTSQRQIEASDHF